MGPFCGACGVLLVARMILNATVVGLWSDFCYLFGIYYVGWDIQEIGNLGAGDICSWWCEGP